MDTSRFLEYFSRALMILLILPLHELAHGFVAKKLGDDTAELSGRITLNPLAHIDPIGSLLLLFTGFGWAKPVPVNPLRMKNPRKGMTLTALAGPVSNLLAAFVIGLIYYFLLCFNFVIEGLTDSGYTPVHCFLMILGFMFQINIGLAVFNMLPIPPLDGFNVLRYFTSAKFDMWIQRNMQYISIGFLIFIILLNNIPSKYNLIIIVSNAVSGIILKCVSWIPEVIGYGVIG